MIDSVSLIPFIGEALSYASSLPQLAGSPYSTAPMQTSLSIAPAPVVLAGKQTEGEVEETTNKRI